MPFMQETIALLINLFQTVIGQSDAHWVTETMFDQSPWSEFMINDQSSRSKFIVH